MSVIIYQEHCDWLKEEVKFLRKQLEYKSLGNHDTRNNEEN